MLRRMWVRIPPVKSHPDHNHMDFTPLPSSANLPVVKRKMPLTQVLCDQRAIARLLDTMIAKAGLTPCEVAKRLGVTDNAVYQYLQGRRTKPSLMWFLRLADLCGAKVTLEFPDKGDVA